METKQHRDRESGWRTVIGVLIVVTCFRVLLGPVTWVDTAQAQIPDSGLQRKQLIDEARQTNQLLQEIKGILTSHTFNVRMEGADNPAGQPTKR